jgi:SNF2 family DNA or RNA helicase
MPAKLERTKDELTLSLAGCRGSEFADVLAKAKEIPGRKFDGERKLWVFPPEAQAAERIMHSIQPTADPSITEWIRDSRQESETELVTPLPDDGELLIPWATQRAPWQPLEINGEKVTGLKAHQRSLVANMQPRCIIADDLGIGKTVQALSYIAECLVRYKCDYESDSLQPSVQKEASGRASGKQSRRLSQTPRGNPGDHQQKEGNSLCGLRDFLASTVYGPGSCEGSGSLYYRQMAVDPANTWKVAGADGSRGASKVRGQVPELPSAEALAGGPKLIVCTLSVTGVWLREIKRWLGEDAVVAIGSTRAARTRALSEGIAEGSWVVTNYESLRVVKEKIKTKSGGIKTVTRMKEPLFEKTDWLSVIFDEAHRLKNRKASQTMGAYRVKSSIMLLLTGTPIQNSPDELWSLLHILYPKEYTSYWRFFESYVDYIEGYFGRDLVGVKNPDALRFELHSRLYRRTKDQVLDLPEKQRITIPVELDAKARKLYAQAEKELWLEVETAHKEGDQAATRFLQEAERGKTIYAIPNGAARTVRLRQILSTPALLGGDDHSNKMDALVESVIDNKHKQHVVFSEFVQSCEILAVRLRSAGLVVETYTGERKQQDRAGIEDDFQQGKIEVLVGTIGAMREGITLTAADTVHFLERSWVPAWNHQAEDRLHRIGQANCVSVYLYEAIDTVDDGTIRLTNSLKDKIVATVLPQDHVEELVA